MQGRDYLKALVAGSYFILSITVLGCLVFVLYAFMKYERSSVSVVITPGSYIGEAGNITPILKAEEVREVINTGVLNGLVATKLKLDTSKLSEIKAVNPAGTDIVQITMETEKDSEGLIILNEFISQIGHYLEQRKTEKLNLISMRNMGSLRAQLATLELNKLRKADELKTVRYELEQLQKTIPAASDKSKATEQLRAKREMISQRQKELGNIDLDINNVRKQIAHLSGFSEREKTISILQEPLITPQHFTERLLKNLLVAGVSFLVFGIILQFIIYDLKLSRKENI